VRETSNTGGLDLRARLLAMSPSELSIKPSEHLPRVWAALLDWGMRGGSATIAVVADGTVSMYTSAGGGMIGAGQHQSIHMPAARFLKTVEAIADSLPEATQAPLPKEGEAAVVALTYAGMRRGFVELRLLTAKDPLARAWVAGQDLITALRELEESLKKGQKK
jgi:hypothetical protein